MRRSKAVLKGKLKDAWTVDVADRLARAEVRIGYEITKLLESHSIATRVADGVVLDRIYSCAILNVKVGAVEDIEGLRLERQRVLFAHTDIPRDTKVYFKNPRAIERMQSHGRAGAESPKGISGGLQGGRVVQNDAQPVAIVKREC